MISLGEHLHRERFMRWWEYSGVWVSEQDRAATFALFDCTGRMGGYQTYRPDRGKEVRNPNDGKGRYYTYSESFAVWGAQTLETGAPLVIVEGIFDAALMNNFGMSTLAVLSHTPPKWFQNYLHVLKLRHPYLLQVKDGDGFGKNLSAADYIVTCPAGEDPSSMGLESFSKFLAKYVPLPQWGLSMFSP